jgi:hypothetical protein
MSEQEQARAQQEAQAGVVTRTVSSAERARLWAGMNRYLAAEAAHAHRVSQSEKPTRPRDTGD